MTETRTRNWRTTPDNTVSVHVAYGQFLREQGWYWYGLPVDDVEKARKFKYPFVVFIADKSTNAFIVPLNVLYQHLQGGSVDNKGNYKMHIFPDGRFEAAGVINLQPYHNEYSRLREANTSRPLQSRVSSKLSGRKAKGVKPERENKVKKTGG